MYFFGVPNLKEINQREVGLKVVVLNQCKEEENQVIFRNIYLTNY